MKMSDLFTAHFPNGSMKTGPREVLESLAAAKWAEIRPAVEMWANRAGTFFAVDFSTASLGMTLKHFDNRAEAEAFRDEVLALDETDFRKRFLGWTD